MSPVYLAQDDLDQASAERSQLETQPLLDDLQQQAADAETAPQQPAAAATPILPPFPFYVDHGAPTAAGAGGGVSPSTAATPAASILPLFDDLVGHTDKPSQQAGQADTGQPSGDVGMGGYRPSAAQPADQAVGQPSGGGGASTPASGDIAGYIRQAAIARNIDPDVAVRVAGGEGGLSNPVQQSNAINPRTGQRETSYGPFQLLIGGGLGDAALAQGVDPRNPAHWQRGVDFALDQAAKSGWGAWYGAARVGVGPRQGLEQARPVGVQAPTSGQGVKQAQGEASGDVVATAQSQTGKPYVWGSAGGRSDMGTDPAGFDCSGLVAWAYGQNGMKLPAFTGDIYKASNPVSADEAKPGDLVMFNMAQGDPHVQHVGIYAGNGQFVHATSAGGQKGVATTPIWQGQGVEFRRVPGAPAAKRTDAAQDVAGMVSRQGPTPGDAAFSPGGGFGRDATTGEAVTPAAPTGFGPQPTEPQDRPLVTDPRGAGVLPPSAAAFTGEQPSTAMAAAPVKAGEAFPVRGPHAPVRPHDGGTAGAVDVFADQGTPVVATQPGKVLFAGVDPEAGNAVITQGRDGTRQLYAHLLTEPAVQAGDVVQPGQPLGQVGNTGEAAGKPPQLHYAEGSELTGGPGPLGGSGTDVNVLDTVRAADQVSDPRDRSIVPPSAQPDVQAPAAPAVPVGGDVRAPGVYDSAVGDRGRAVTGSVTDPRDVGVLPPSKRYGQFASTEFAPPAVADEAVGTGYGQVPHETSFPVRTPPDYQLLPQGGPPPTADQALTSGEYGEDIVPLPRAYEGAPGTSTMPGAVRFASATDLGGAGVGPSAAPSPPAQEPVTDPRDRGIVPPSQQAALSEEQPATPMAAETPPAGPPQAATEAPQAAPEPQRGLGATLGQLGTAIEEHIGGLVQSAVQKAVGAVTGGGVTQTEEQAAQQLAEAPPVTTPEQVGAAVRGPERMTQAEYDAMQAPAETNTPPSPEPALGERLGGAGGRLAQAGGEIAASATTPTEQEGLSQRARDAYLGAVAASEGRGEISPQIAGALRAQQTVADGIDTARRLLTSSAFQGIAGVLEDAVPPLRGKVLQGTPLEQTGAQALLGATPLGALGMGPLPIGRVGGALGGPAGANAARLATGSVGEFARSVSEGGLAGSAEALGARVAEPIREAAGAVARAGEGMLGRRVVPPDVARGLPGEPQLNELLNRDPDTFEALAVAADRHGGEVTSDGVELPLQRFQKPDLPGEEAMRGGVFYATPGEAEGYRQPPGHEASTGGSQEVSGPTLFKNPLVTWSGEGGAGGGSGIDNALREVKAPVVQQDVWNAASNAMRGPSRLEESFESRANYLRGFLDRAGGDSSVAAQMLERVPSDELKYTISENIIANRARQQGYDGWIKLKDRSDPRIFEIMDFREGAYPHPGGAPPLTELPKGYRVEEGPYGRGYAVSRPDGQFWHDTQSVSPEEASGKALDRLNALGYQELPEGFTLGHGSPGMGQPEVYSVNGSVNGRRIMAQAPTREEAVANAAAQLRASGDLPSVEGRFTLRPEFAPPGPAAGITEQRAPLGAQLARGAAGGAVAGGYEASQQEGATPESAIRGALVGAAGGAVRAGVARGAGVRQAATLAARAVGEGGRAEDNRTWAASLRNPEQRYQFHYEVQPLDRLVTSHTDALEPNPRFPQELQPRERSRAASADQINRIAARLNPDELLAETHRLDSGAPIIGKNDTVVESGNGRTLALRQAREQYPERWQAYQDALREHAAGFGIVPEDMAGMKDPVLVRVRDTPVGANRAAFAAEANQATTLAMSPHEQAMQDARRLPDHTVASLTVGENQGIDQALRSTANRQAVRDFAATVPPNERAMLMDDRGNLNQAGYERLKSALFARTYEGEAGNRLAQAFFESADPGIRNIQNGLMAALPDMARAEALIRTGQRDAELSLAPDVAAAVDMLARLRASETSVGDYLAQTAMFGRETTPLQDELIRAFDAGSRRPSVIRTILREYADAVERQPAPSQVGMFGEVARPTKGELLDAITQREGAFSGAEAVPAEPERVGAEPGAAAPGAGPQLEGPAPGAVRPPEEPRPGRAAPQEPAPANPEAVAPGRGTLQPPTTTEPREPLPGGGERAQQFPGMPEPQRFGRPEDIRRLAESVVSSPEARAAPGGAHRVRIAQEAVRASDRPGPTAEDYINAYRIPGMLAGPRQIATQSLSNAVMVPIGLVAESTKTPHLLPARAAAMIGGMADALIGQVPDIIRGARPKSGGVAAQAVREMPEATGPVGLAIQRGLKVYGTPARLGVEVPDAVFWNGWYEAGMLGEAAKLPEVARFRAYSSSWMRAIDEARANPTPEVAAAGRELADVMTFKNQPGAIGGIPGYLKQSPARVMTDWIIPFWKANADVFARGVDMTPLGIAGTAWDVARGVYQREGMPRLLPEGFPGAVRSAVPAGQEVLPGVAGQVPGRPTGVLPLLQRTVLNLTALPIALAGYEASNQGLVTGNGPPDPAQRRAMMDQGWRPNSFKVGPWYLPLAVLGPVGVSLNNAAIMAERKRYVGQEPTDKQVGYLVGSYANLLRDQTWVGALADTFDLLKSATSMNMNEIGDQFARWGGGMAGSLIPESGLVGAAATAADPYMRQPERTREVGGARALGEQVQGRIPGAVRDIPGMQDFPTREQLPARQRALGGPVENANQFPLGILAPRASMEVNDPTMEMLGRYNVGVQTPTFMTLPAPRGQRGPGTRIDLSTAEQQEWREAAGPLIRKYVDETMRLPDWSRLLPDQQKRELQKAITDAHRDAAGPILDRKDRELRGLAPVGTGR